MLTFLYLDEHIAVCIKPPRVLSTDEPGGMPDLIRETIGQPQAKVRAVHRLDQVVGGLMVYGLTGPAASELSRQIREGSFEKKYLAVVHGAPEEDSGELRDLLGRDKARKMTFVAEAPGKGIQEAVLSYRVLNKAGDLSRVEVTLFTGRTHQIRVQFASRGYPLVGDHKYGARDTETAPRLFSCALTFPWKGKTMRFEAAPDWLKTE